MYGVIQKHVNVYNSVLNLSLNTDTDIMYSKSYLRDIHTCWEGLRAVKYPDIIQTQKTTSENVTTFQILSIYPPKNTPDNHNNSSHFDCQQLIDRNDWPSCTM